MAQPILSYISLAVAKRLGDEVTLYTDNGDTFTALDRLDKINLARKEVYNETLKALGGIDKFIEAFPELMKVASKNSTLEADVKKVFRVTLNQIVARPVPEQFITDALYNPYSKWKGNADRYYFVEYGGIVQIIGQTHTTVTMTYLWKPVDITGFTGGDPDVVDPNLWYEAIISKAVAILESEQQVV